MLSGHTRDINNFTIAPDGSLGASGGKDGVIRLWDFYSACLLESESTFYIAEQEEAYKFDAGELINVLCFWPKE